MAERVKRRVAAARLAVAFVAAGTIAGAAWAQAGPPTAEPSALNAYKKLSKQVKKLNSSIKTGLGDVRLQLGDVKAEADAIKGELGSYVKGADADTRYLKQSDPVVRGNGSVFSESRLITVVVKHVTVMTIPNLITIEAENGKPPLFYVVNETGGALTHTGCEGGGGTFGSPPGVIQPGKFFYCRAPTEPATVQLFGEGADPIVITLTVSGIPAGQGTDVQYTAQVLVGT